MVKFDATPDEVKLVKQIVARAIKDGKKRGSIILAENLEMDLIATHANGCPMDFERLVNASDFDFWHDLSGIRAHLDRKTGNLSKHFYPRFSKRRAD